MEEKQNSTLIYSIRVMAVVVTFVWRQIRKAEINRREENSK